MKHLFHIGILAAAAAVAASTADAQGAGATKLDGRWTGSLTRAQILHATRSKSLAEKLHGSWTAQLGKGHFEFHDRDTGTDARGKFFVSRNRVTFFYATGVGIKKGQVGEYTWNVYRNRLTFKTVPGRPAALLDLFVWTRGS
jgi:hypothetical protein